MSKTNIENIITICINDLKNDLSLEKDIDAVAVFIVENIINNNMSIKDIIKRVKQELSDNADLY
jgi:hypothetical protein